MALPLVTIYADASMPFVNTPADQLVHDRRTGGWATLLITLQGRHTLHGGFRRTSIVRCEMWAAIYGLASLKERSQVVVFTDSIYVVDGMRMPFNTLVGPTKHLDLWGLLTGYALRHQTEFRHVPAHSAFFGNAYVDAVARAAAYMSDFETDIGYETEQAGEMRVGKGIDEAVAAYKKAKSKQLFRFTPLIG